LPQGSVTATEVIRLHLYVTVNQVKGQRGKILAESFVDAKKVWEENSRGSFVAASAEGEVRGMLKSINEKIKKHVGGPDFSSDSSDATDRRPQH
jgi:hypothetical protein